MSYFLMTIKKMITITAENDPDAYTQAIDYLDSLGLDNGEWDFELDTLDFPEAKTVVH